MRAISIMGRYAVGDLSQDMPLLPGDKRVITETMAAIKTNLAAINSEIKRLGSAAAAGDFSQEPIKNAGHGILPLFALNRF